MATFRNKTTSEGVIILWKPYPEHGRPSTYQVKDNAVELLSNLGFEVPNPGDEVEVPWSVCRPLRILDDLYFKNKQSENIDPDDIGDFNDEEFAEELSKRQKNRLGKYISDHQNCGEYSDELGNEVSSVSTSGGDKKKDDLDNSSSLSPGDILTAEVSSVSDSGNGIIDTRGGQVDSKNGAIRTDASHINIGPIKESAKGEYVKIEIINKMFAVCVNKTMRSEAYMSVFRKTAHVKINEYTNPEINSVQFCVECGSPAIIIVEDRWRCGTCDEEFDKEALNNHWPEFSSEEVDPPESNSGEGDLPAKGDVLIDVSLTHDDRGNGCLECNSRVKVTGNFNYDELYDVRVKTRRSGYVVTNVVADKNDYDSNEVVEFPNNTESKSIGQLEREAKKASRQHVSGDSETTSVVTTYSRSQKVKDYVMARADGVCEMCDNPAPFTSESGDPYLQAHHIHELSEGGSDSPDNVAAICPNCHYEIHHGKNGEKQNQQLSKQMVGN